MIEFRNESDSVDDELKGVEFMYYDILYLMTDNGTVYRAFGNPEDRRFKKSKPVLQSGTAKLILTCDKKRKAIDMGKLVMQLLRGEVRDRRWTVKKKDGDEFNCHPDNLEWIPFGGRNHGKNSD